VAADAQIKKEVAGSLLVQIPKLITMCPFSSASYPHRDEKRIVAYLTYCIG